MTQVTVELQVRAKVKRGLFRKIATATVIVADSRALTAGASDALLEIAAAIEADDVTQVANKTGRPEPILTPSEWDALRYDG